jgi:hypothetical protein
MWSKYRFVFDKCSAFGVKLILGHRRGPKTGIEAFIIFHDELKLITVVYGGTLPYNWKQWWTK